MVRKRCVPLHPVISFSVINYVVSMRRPRVSGEVSFLFIYSPQYMIIRHKYTLPDISYI